MAEDNFKDWKRSIDSVSGAAFAVTPSDSADINATRALYIGAAGDVAVVMADDASEVTFVGVTAGAILPVRVSRVKATGTTATSIVGLL